MTFGFKEWEIVCKAMEQGTQSIILRKGGIAEGRGGFQFEHREFFLFPTLFHEQGAKIRAEYSKGFYAPAKDADTERPTIAIRLFARIEFHRTIENWETAAKLEPFHIWREEEIRKRFDWEKAPGISLAFVRVYRLEQPWTLANRKSFGGCRSWVQLPDPENDDVGTPVLDDRAHDGVRQRLDRVLNE